MINKIARFSYHIGTSHQLKPISEKLQSTYITSDDNYFSIDLKSKHKDKFVVAICNNEIAGAWNFKLEGPKTYRKLHSYGIVVNPKYQKMGIASTLMYLGLKIYDIKHVYARYVTDRGFTLYNKMMKQRPDIYWDVKSWMKRKAIDLKEKKSNAIYLKVI